MRHEPVECIYEFFFSRDQCSVIKHITFALLQKVNYKRYTSYIAHYYYSIISYVCNIIIYCWLVYTCSRKSYYLFIYLKIDFRFVDDYLVYMILQSMTMYKLYVFVFRLKKKKSKSLL